MKTVGICTIYDENNYGNRLQNYAVQELLRGIGLCPITIKYENFESNYQLYKWVFVHRVKQLIKIVILRDKRVKNFLKFDQRYIKSTKKYYNGRMKCKLQYDYYVAGSDQVWNPELNRLSRMDLLTAFDSGVKFSLSASVGVEELSEENESKLKRAVSEMTGISVREETAKKFIEDISNKEVVTLLDPTMLVERSVWDAISKCPRALPNKYMIVFFLGKVSRDTQERIESISAETGYTIVKIGDAASDFYGVGPEEFVYLLGHAGFVFTDSFHATAFSILYQIPFFVVSRNYGNIEMNSRIHTLLEHFSFEKRYVADISSTTVDLEMDYSNTKKILCQERLKFNQFIEECIILE